MAYGYVYIIKTPEGHCYVGQHKCSTKFDRYYYGSGKFINDYYKTHSKKDVEISVLEYAETKEELSKLEIEYIEALSPDFNISHQPYCNPEYKNITTEETRKKMSEKAKERMKDPIYFQNAMRSLHSAETYFQISETVKTKWKNMSDAERKEIGEKISKRNKEKIDKLSDDERKKKYGYWKGKRNSKLSQAKKGKEPWNKGKKMSDEFKKKCSKSHRGKKLSEEHKENVRQSLLNYWEKKKNE